MSWETVSFDSIKLKPRRKSGHSFTHLKGLTWPLVCDNCGLCALKNERTQVAIKAGCYVEIES